MCDPGTSNDEEGSTDISSCSDCAKGKYAPESGSKECTLCPKDKITTSAGKHTECTDCPPGMTTVGQGVDGGDTGATTCVDAPDKPCLPGQHRVKKGEACVDCKARTYSPSGLQCLHCPPGSFCGNEGMSSPEECPVGRYTDTKNRQSCTPCPAGRYQNSTGSAKCLFCPRGKYLPSSNVGANSSALCIMCSLGTYGDKEGLGDCSRCPTGQVQPKEGQFFCKECVSEGKIKTNNVEHTACIDNKALMSSSVVEAMFTKGVGLSLSFGIAALFVCLAGVMHYMKTGYNNMNAENKLGALGIPQVVLKAAMPGFSFGSEVVLIMGMTTEAPRLGWLMLAARLLHPCTMAVLTLAIPLADSGIVPDFLRNLVRDSPLSREFSRMKVPPVCLLFLASSCDVTMLQLMPWVNSQFYEVSVGYPSFRLMLVCMIVKAVSSLVSVVCQVLFLFQDNDLNDPLMSTQAKILFGFSIVLSSTTLIMGMIMLVAKWGLLKDLNEKNSETQAQAQGQGQDSSTTALEFGDLYKDDSSTNAWEGRESTSFHNPMHAAAMEENSSLKEQLEASRVVIEEQRKEIELLKQQQQMLVDNL